MVDTLITLRVPERILEHYTQVAAERHVSIEEALIESLTQQSSTADFPEFSSLSDDALWEIVRFSLTEAQRDRLDALADRDGDINAQEASELVHLTQIVNSQMLARSEALVLLKERGNDVAGYFQSFR